MRNAGPLFANTRVSAEALHRHVVTMVEQTPVEETERERLAREYADFELRAPVVEVVEVVEERRDGLRIFRARLSCGHTQGAGSSGRYSRIRCGACYAVLLVETRGDV